MLESSINALLAAAVPSVIPSIFSKSVSLISAFPIIKLPAVIEPVVRRFSSPKEIAPDESVILPFASVKFPILEPVAAVKVPLLVIAPDEIVPKPVTLPLVSNLLL